MGLSANVSCCVSGLAPQHLLIDLFPVGKVAFLRDFETGELHGVAVDLSAGFHHMPKLLD